MDQITDPSSIEREVAPVAPGNGWRIRAAAAVIAAAAIGSGVYFGLYERHDVKAAIPPAAAPKVTVSKPLQQDVDTRMGSLGQFSAITASSSAPRLAAR